MNNTAPPAPDSERRELEFRAAALLELERRKRDFPLWWYEPSKAMEPFHSSRCVLRQLCGANRCGKTETSHAEAAAYLLGYRPWVLRKLGLPQPEHPWERPPNLPPEAICYDGAGIRVKVPNTGLIISGLPLKKGIGEITAPKLRKLLGPLIEKEYVSHANTPSKMVLKNGSVVHFASDEMDRMAFEGAAYDWIGSDEPHRKSTYVSLRRGSIDNFAPMWFSYTPIGANAAWMFRDLYTKADGKRIFAQTCSIFDNDYLSKEAIEEFVNDPAVSDIEKQARVYGRFQNLFDTIYANFDPEVHVIPAMRPPESWYRAQVVDPHTVKPWAVAWAAVNERGDIIIWREWPNGDFTKIRRDTRGYDGYQTLFASIERDEYTHLRLMDPNYGPRRDNVRGTVIESAVSEMAKRGFTYFHQLNDNLEFGESKVRSLLHFNKDQPVSAINRPKFYVTEDCPNTIAALSFYTAKQDASGDPNEEKRDPSFKDFADLVRYLAVSPLAAIALSDSPRTTDDDYQDDVVTDTYGEP